MTKALVKCNIDEADTMQTGAGIQDENVCVTDNLLHSQFKIPDCGVKCLKDLEARDIYKILMFSEVTELKSKTYWCTKFDDKVIEFDKWFTCLFVSKLTPRKCIDFNWRIFHGQVNTEQKLQKMGFSDGYCKICKLEKENVEHLLLECSETYMVWGQIKNMVCMVRKNDYTWSKFTRLIGYLDSSIESQICNMILSITRWIIWKRRCSIKYEKEIISQLNLLKHVKHEIMQHTKVLMNCKIDMKVKFQLQELIGHFS